MLRTAVASTGSCRTCTSNMRSNQRTASRNPAPAAVTTSIGDDSRTPAPDGTGDPDGLGERIWSTDRCRASTHRGTMGLELEGAVAVVTGAAGGIGTALVGAFTGAGAAVVSTDLPGRGADV